MKLTVDTKPLKAALAAAGRVIPNKVVIPAIGAVKVISNDDRLTICATNLDMCIEQDIAGSVTTEGAALIPFAPFAAFVSAAKGSECTIEASRDAIIVRSGRGRISLAPRPVADFPDIRAQADNEATVDAGPFCKAMKFCVAAASDEEARYYLRGVYVESAPDGLNFWGTNGHAMHRVVMPEMDIGSGIFPNEAVNMIVASFATAGTFRIGISDRGWQAVGQSLRVWGKVIEGTYPEVRRLLKTFGGGESIAICAAEEVAQAISVAQVGNDGSSRAVVIRAEAGAPLVLRGLNSANGVLKAGRAETVSEARGNAVFCVSATYLSAALAGFADDEVDMFHVENGCRIEAAQASATATATAVIMGIRSTPEEMADA